MGDLDLWLDNLDSWNIARAQVPVNFGTPDETFDRLSHHADRIFVSLRVDPHDGMIAVRRIDDLARRYPILKSVMIVPHMLYPHIAPNSREYYPIYSKCIEHDLAVMLNVGFPGPRVPAWTQDPDPCRRGLLVLPRSTCRVQARRRALDRNMREDDADLAERLFRDQWFCAQVLPEGCHGPRQPAGIGQGHIRRLLAHALLREDLPRGRATCRCETRSGRSSWPATPSAHSVSRNLRRED